MPKVQHAISLNGGEVIISKKAFFRPKTKLQSWKRKDKILTRINRLAALGSAKSFPWRRFLAIIGREGETKSAHRPQKPALVKCSSKSFMSVGSCWPAFIWFDHEKIFFRSSVTRNLIYAFCDSFSFQLACLFSLSQEMLFLTTRKSVKPDQTQNQDDSRGWC